MGALDVFTQQCKGHKLSKKFWSTRVVKGVRKHIRAFASEALDAMYILTLYCAEHEVASWPSMIQHVRALEVMNSIAMITSRPKDILLNLETWEQCEAEYQQLQQALYATKPKCHLGRHCVDSVREHGVFMSCWSPERDHHRSKLIARNCFNKCCKSILDRCNHHFHQDLLNSNELLKETYLFDAVPCTSFEAQFPGVRVLASQRAMTHIGGLSRGGFVHVVHLNSATTALVQLDLFLELQRSRTQQFFLLVGKAYALAPDQRWIPTGKHVSAPLERAARRNVVHVQPDTNIVRATL